MVLETDMKLCVVEPCFLKKNRNMDQNHGFIDFIELFGLYFFVKLVYNESFYYLLYSYTNLISEKNLGPCQIGLPLPNFRPLFSLFTDWKHLWFSGVFIG